MQAGRPHHKGKSVNPRFLRIAQRGCGYRKTAKTPSQMVDRIVKVDMFKRGDACTMFRNYQAAGIVWVIVFFCLAPLHADQIPGSTLVVDPFILSFNETVNAMQGTTNDNGATTSAWGALQGFDAAAYGADPVSNPGTFLTFPLPAQVTSGDLVILPAGSPVLSGLTDIDGSGIYNITAAYSDADPVSGALRFYTVDAQSYMQFYYNGSFGELFPVYTDDELYAIVASGNPASFAFNVGLALGKPDNVYDGVFAVPEPRESAALVGLVCLGLAGMAWRFRNRLPFPLNMGGSTGFQPVSRQHRQDACATSGGG